MFLSIFFYFKRVFTTVNNKIVVSNIVAPNGSYVLPNITGLSSGLNFWNVSCVDDNENSNSSTTSSFTYDKTEMAISIQTIENRYNPGLHFPRLC